MKTTTPSDLIMENIAVYDALKREGFAESVIDRIERAVNSHDELLHASKKLLQEIDEWEVPQTDENGQFPLVDQLRNAIVKAERSK